MYVVDRPMDMISVYDIFDCMLDNTVYIVSMVNLVA